MAGVQPVGGKPAGYFGPSYYAGNSLTSRIQSANIALTTGGVGYG